jgi:feruloyl esterase
MPAKKLAFLLASFFCFSASHAKDAWHLSAASADTYSGECSSLGPALQGLPNTQITSTETVNEGILTVGGKPIAAHCLVKGKMFERTSAVDGKNYAISFEMRLPRQWNGRFLHQGNGGIDGVVQPAVGAFGGGPLSNALDQGFVVLSSDAGHAGATPAFGIDPQARLDYGYQAVGKLTPMAKSVIEIVYGKRPDRSYFAGCSNGGRHALVTAARYFQDYDGILAGAPGYNLPKAATANLAGARLYQSIATTQPVKNHIDLATGLTDQERRLVADKVLEKCDALDGAKDGLIQNTAACQVRFKLSRDVPSCTSERNASCLTEAQKQVLETIFSGPKTSNGKLIYASFPFDAGFSGGRSGVTSGGSPVGSGIAFWEFFASLNLDSGATGLIFQVPPQDPANFDPVKFSLTTDLDALYDKMFTQNDNYTESAMSFMTPPNATQLKGLRDKGGKILVYHGVSDSIFSIHDSENWLKGVQKDTGKNFAKLYPVPGMGHCSGGPSTDQFDLLTPLVKWVERGEEPQAILAASRSKDNAGGANSDVPDDWSPARTRPLCPYPQVAIYKGKGSIEQASSFSCR